MSDDSLTFDYTPGNPTDTFAVTTAAGTEVGGMLYTHDEWDVSIVLTPRAWTPGYFRFAETPVDQHTGAVVYAQHKEPPPVKGGTWVRVQVSDQ